MIWDYVTSTDEIRLSVNANSLIAWLNERIAADQDVLNELNKDSAGAVIVFSQMTRLQSVLEFIQGSNK